MKSNSTMKFVALFVCLLGGFAFAADKPNIVIFFTDDQGMLDANCYGSKDLYTPTMDMLAKTGVRFTQAYAHTVCCPARAMLMTGRQPQRGNVNNWTQGNAKGPKGPNMFLEEVTIAEVLNRAGYKTALFGKWHLGADLEHGPTKQGFDEFFGLRGGFIHNYNHYFLHGTGFHDLYEGTEEVFARGKYFPDMVTGRAMQFIDDNKDTPFFMYVAFNIPHYPEQPDKKFDDRYKDMEMPRRSYAKMISTTDDRMGMIVGHLEKQGLRDNTIIVFMSDNGYSTEEIKIRRENHKSGMAVGTNYGANGGGGNTGKWLGHKGTFLEGGIRVPAVISYPAKLPKGVVRDQAITAMDWMPTILDLCDVPLPDVKFDGKNILPVIKSASAKSPYDVMHWKWRNGWAVRQGDWKLIGEGKESKSLGNLSDRQPEKKNYIKEKPELAKRLKTLHDEWVKEVTVVEPSKALEKYQLLPAPRQISYGKGFCQLTAGSCIRVGRSAGDGLVEIAEDIKRSLGGLYGELKLSSANLNDTSVVIRVAPKVVSKQQGYQLSIQPEKIEIIAHDQAGVFYAAQTLKQMCRAGGGKLRCLEVNDWPDFANRGIMIDVSRDKVPTMKTLYEMVDKFSSWKINQIQLYTEHAFAYKNHETVWKDASPMTPEQIRKLDAYCRRRFIELVGNQNSFGHMNRWLKHNRYSHLAETPGGSDLSPVMPGSIELLRDMYDDLLPNFTSRQFNVGCDETWSLGKGKSKAAAKERGVGKVYFGFLMEIYKLCKERGVKMQFWGDIIMHHPELIPDLPENIIAMVWGYRPDHPYNTQCPQFQKSGVPFYVCPGTSSWMSFSGRTKRALTNIRNAAENGKKFGAIGLLLTDWGDHGHWQTYPCSFPAFVYGAGLSWSIDANKEANIPSLLDRYVYMDDAKIMGKLVCDIGNSYAAAEGYFDGNTSYLARVLMAPKVPITNSSYKWLTPEKILTIKSHAMNALKPLDKARLECHDAELVIPEIRHSGNLVLFACDILQARFAVKDGEVKNIPARQRKQLAETLKKLIKEHESIWLKRNRIGGLSDSSKEMEELLEMLESK